MSGLSTPVTVVIPGYMGTTLHDSASGKAVWNGLTMFWVDYRRMRLSREGADSPDRPALVPRNPLWPVYPGLIRRLRKAGHKTFFFPFDWRKSLPQMVEKFDHFISTNLPAVPFNIVAHSMGGHIAAAWLAGKESSAVERFAAVGMPILGAEKAITILLVGDERIARFNIRTSAQLLRSLAWDVPSIYEMLPPLPGIYRRDFWPPDSGIREDLLASASRTRKLINNGITALAGLGERALMVAGIGDKTETWIKAPDRPLTASDMKIEAGDGWIRQDTVAIEGIPTYAFRRKWTDIFALKLHFPSARALGSHPVLPMFRSIQNSIIDFLAGRRVTSLPPLHQA